MHLAMTFSVSKQWSMNVTKQDHNVFYLVFANYIFVKMFLLESCSMMVQAMIAANHMGVAQFIDIIKKQRPYEPWRWLMCFCLFLFGTGWSSPIFHPRCPLHSKTRLFTWFTICTLLYRKCTFFQTQYGINIITMLWEGVDETQLTLAWRSISLCLSHVLM